MNKEQAIEIVKILQALIEISKASIIQNTFINSFKNNSLFSDNELPQYYLYGNFNIGGTVSGRLSSSNPNLQNIPSTGSIYAPLIKKCIQHIKSDWILTGVDFDSLEDKVSALTTKDPNKLKVYEEHYDGHCLRAYNYFKEQMPDIQDTLESINSIEKKYKSLRQESKGPTFALTYQGTWRTLVKNLGMTIEKAKHIEKEYHRLYAVADKWVKDKLIQASKDGYVTLAFGLRLRTPILKQVIFDGPKVPYEAQKEARTAGNALGQSYGLLNNRAAIEFQNRVFNSNYIYDIKPIMHIHDSQYFLIRNNPEVFKWYNDNLIECIEWQELPEIQHSKVKLSGSVEIYYPTQANSIKVPNKASLEEITQILQQIK